MQMNRFKQFARQNWLLLGVFALAMVVALWFAVQFTLNFLYFNDPRNKDVDLKGWMTPRYVVMTYDLPRPLVAELLGLTDPSQRGQSLRRIADDMGLTMEELTELVRAEAAIYREAEK